MTTEKMTVHKALAELKVLDDRILAAIGACNLVTTKKNNQDKVVLWHYGIRSVLCVLGIGEM